MEFAGDRLQYTNWVPGRKNNFQNHDSEDCVIFLPYKQGQWDDVPCGYSGFMFHHHDQGEVHPYICEYSKFYIHVHVDLIVCQSEKTLSIKWGEIYVDIYITSYVKVHIEVKICRDQELKQSEPKSAIKIKTGNN